MKYWYLKFKKVISLFVLDNQWFLYDYTVLKFRNFYYHNW